MNILIYTQWSTYLNYQVGGAETSLRILAEKLASEGHRVFYLTEEKGGRMFRHRSETVEGVEVHIINLPNLPTLGIGPLLKIRRWLIEYSFQYMAEKLIREKKIDLVHTYHEVPGMARFLKLKKDKNLEFCTVLRNAGKFWVKNLKETPHLRQRYQSVFNDVDSINFITAGLKKMFEEACREMNLDVHPKHCLIQDIGLDLQKIDCEWNPPADGAFKMIMASRFSSHQKRQDILVEAVARLPESMAVKLYLVGNGPKQEIIKEKIKEWNLEHRISVTSFLPQGQLWELMSTCHLYVHSCDFEGLGKIIVEAMAMGMPVLTSDVLPLNDYIKHGKNGFLAKNDPESWSSRICEIYNNSESHFKISQQAKKFVQFKYRADVNVKKYTAYFKEVIQRGEELQRK